MKVHGSVPIVRMMIALAAGLRPSRDPHPQKPMPDPPELRPRPRPRRRRASTNDLVLCIHCDAMCEPIKGSGAKASAMLAGWHKVCDDQFECPECRKGTIP